MSNERDRLIEVVGDALRLPTGERVAFVHSACPDPGEREEALSLLGAAEGAGGFMDRPTMGEPSAAGGRGERAGSAIGRYRLLELIGEGGFGRVFMAEQREPVHRRVAVKVIKAGMDTSQVVARFEAERQALAMMDHPGIARVFDGGATESGRPYFVMELVRGAPITTYCDRANLSIKERLALFREVCAAVQHAHQKGVIHRDLKPGNVLVTESDGRAQPKIIDFGIAKATSGRLTDRTLFTEYRQLIGTPEYMSPEQALGAAGGAYRNADVDTRSDIYSLGVILYELLTGTTPLDPVSLRSVSLAEVQRLILDEETPRPSTRFSTLAARGDVAARRCTEPGRLGVLLRGDLDWIVLKALEKDRDRRYETASALAEDLRRYLEDEPVLATPPSAAYRVRKLVRRHRAAVFAGSAVAAALVIGLGAALWQGRVAARERDAARAAADDTRRVAEFQAAQLRGIDPQVMGTGLREDLLTGLGTAMEGQDADPARAAEQRARLEALLGEINLTDVALRSLDRNIFARAIAAANAEFEGQPLLRAGLLLTIADSMQQLGLLEGATAPLAEGLAIRRRELGEDHADTIRASGMMGMLLAQQGRLGDAEPYAVEGLERARRVLGEDHPVAVDALSNLGYLRRRQNRIGDAEESYRAALEKHRRLTGPDELATLRALGNVGLVLLARGRASEAEPYARETLAGFRRRLGDDHPDTIRALGNLGICLRLQGKDVEAEALYREGLERQRRRLGEDHPDTIRSLANLGDLLRDRIARQGGNPDAGDAAEAEAVLRLAVERRRRRLGGEHQDTLDALHSLGMLLNSLGRPGEAETALREARDGFARAQGLGSPGAVMSALSLATSLARQSRFSESEALLLETARATTGHGAELCAPDFVDLYTAWHVAEPGKGYDAKAAEWRARLSPQG